MSELKSQPPQAPAPQQAQTQPPAAQPTAPKPDKTVSVPEYDLLTEGYDPAKLKNR